MRFKKYFDDELEMRNKQYKRKKSKTPVIPDDEFMTREELNEMLDARIIS